MLATVAPDVQGRVFAGRSLMFQIVSAVAFLIAGPLADYVFESAMRPGGNLAKLLGGVFGTHAGAGMAVMYVTTSICLLLVGLGGYACRSLRDLDDSSSSGGGSVLPFLQPNIKLNDSDSEQSDEKQGKKV